MWVLDKYEGKVEDPQQLMATLLNELKANTRTFVVLVQSGVAQSERRLRRADLRCNLQEICITTPGTSLLMTSRGQCWSCLAEVCAMIQPAQHEYEHSTCMNTAHVSAQHVSGGAFLHPTHVPETTLLDYRGVSYSRLAAYPAPQICRRCSHCSLI